MKILHTSDLHLGKKVNEFSMIDEQIHILNQIVDIVKKEEPDCLIIAGDIYDKSVPNAQAVTIFDEFLTEISRAGLSVFIISGNHDSAERIAFGGRLMEKNKIYFSPLFNGTVNPITLNDEFGEVDFYLLPFLKPANVRRFFENEDIKNTNDAVNTVISSLNINKNRRNVLVAHQFVTGAVTCDSEEISVGGTEEVDWHSFMDFDYVALGHIHGQQKIGDEKIRYSGTPLKYSFSEVNHKKSVTLIELEEKNKSDISLIPITPIHDMRRIKGTFDELMLKENYINGNKDDYMHIILQDEEDVVDGIKKLKIIYPNILRLDYDNKRTAGEVSQYEEDKSPMELFSDFYRMQNGADLSENQQVYAEKIMENIIDKQNG